MFDLGETIAAITTPKGTGGIAGIRISGSRSWEIIKNFFSASRTNNKSSDISLFHMQASYGYIKDHEKVIDEVIIIPFKAPKSFTSEDVIEIYCHGGSSVSSMILNLCLKHGARLAKAGEFTFRAFVNGRIDLTEAEAINEIINADSDNAVYAASSVLSGSLKQKVTVFREKILELITSIESQIEFPMDVPDFSRDKIIFVLSQICCELNELINCSNDGRMLRDGIKISIIGAPNVGKSSLLNLLVGDKRAIVTDLPGTTRDTIEEKVLLEGYSLVFTDTAGIRENISLGEVELLGIEKSKESLKVSDIAMFVFDLGVGLDKESEKILCSLKDKPKIIVGNKIDLSENGNNCALLFSNESYVSISAKYGTNLDLLKKLIVAKIEPLFTTGKFFSPKTSVPIYVNQRQKEILLQCSSAINEAILMLETKGSDDLIADELKNALSKLDEVSGRTVNDKIITNIFAKFCIGK